MGELTHRIHPPKRILDPDDELLLSRYCFVLALFEHLARRYGFSQLDSPLKSLPAGATVDDLLALADDEWVKDIGPMAVLFGRRYSSLFHAKVRLNPSHLSSIGGFGADADLLINDYVIDIKTTLEPRLDPAWMYQVLGYALLPSPRTSGIQGVGFYLARQGIFVRWPLSTFLPRLTGRQDADAEQLHRDFLAVLGKLSYC